MIRRVLCGLIALCIDVAAAPSTTPVAVLDGPDVEPLGAALKRIGQPFVEVRELNPVALTSRRVLVIAGSKPPVDASGAKIIETFLNDGGAVLGVGQGATCMIKHGLFDAQCYFLTGTTIHMTVFHGYHRLMFGYPGAKPFDGWVLGVPNLLRATEGPLMILGPKATSVLGYDNKGLYSAVAFQRIGRGIVLLIGPDPQGGRLAYALGKSKLQSGDKLGTDGLLANALAFLLDPTCNLVPNSGFEELIDRMPRQSHWLARRRAGATREWCKQGALQGRAFLKIVCPGKVSYGEIAPYLPIVVERRGKYRFSCLYKSSAPWRVELRLLKGMPPAWAPRGVQRFSISPNTTWHRFEAKLTVPADVSYVKPTLVLEGKGELCVDDVTMRRRME